MAVDENDFRSGDTDNNILRKLLNRFKQFIDGGISLNVSDVEIGAVEIKDSTTDNRVEVVNAAPSVGDFGLVVYPVGGAGGGDASAANQVIGNASLASIDGKTPPPGQAAMASSSPVVIASDQSAVPVSGAFFQATQPVSAVTLPLPTGASTEATLSSLNGKVPVQGQALMAASVPVTIASNQSTVPVSGAFFQATQPVSIAATVAISAAALPLPAGAATEATLSSLNTKIPASPSTDRTTAAAPFSTRLSDGAAFYDSTKTGQLPAALIGGRLDVNIGASSATVPVSGTFFQATQPISAAALPLPTGAATETTLGTRLADATFTGRINTQGQKAMAASTPVVIASDQSLLLVSTKTALTASAPTAGSVGVASAQLVASAATRKGLVLVNTSAATVSLGFGSTAVLNSGVTLLPGDSWSMDEYCFFTGAINAIASVAASNVAVQEFTT